MLWLLVDSTKYFTRHLFNIQFSSCRTQLTENQKCSSNDTQALVVITCLCFCKPIAPQKIDIQIYNRNPQCFSGWQRASLSSVSQSNYLHYPPAGKGLEENSWDVNSLTYNGQDMAAWQGTPLNRRFWRINNSSNNISRNWKLGQTIDNANSPIEGLGHVLSIQKLISNLTSDDVDNRH